MFLPFFCLLFPLLATSQFIGGDPIDVEALSFSQCDCSSGKTEYSTDAQNFFQNSFKFSDDVESATCTNELDLNGFPVSGGLVFSSSVAPKIQSTTFDFFENVGNPNYFSRMNFVFPLKDGIEAELVNILSSGDNITISFTFSANAIFLSEFVQFELKDEVELNNDLVLEFDGTTNDLEIDLFFGEQNIFDFNIDEERIVRFMCALVRSNDDFFLSQRFTCAEAKSPITQRGQKFVTFFGDLDFGEEDSSFRFNFAEFGRNLFGVLPINKENKKPEIQFETSLEPVGAKKPRGSLPFVKETEITVLSDGSNQEVNVSKLLSESGFPLEEVEFEFDFSVISTDVILVSATGPVFLYKPDRDTTFSSFRFSYSTDSPFSCSSESIFVGINLNINFSKDFGRIGIPISVSLVIVVVLFVLYRKRKRKVVNAEVVEDGSFNEENIMMAEVVA